METAARERPMLICVVGDSLSLPRHFDGLRYDQTYAFLVADWWRQRGRAAYVWPISKAGVPVQDLLAQYRAFRVYAGERFGEIGLVQVGIVDCSPRPLPFTLRRWLGRLPGRVAAPIVRFLHSNRRALLRAGLSFRFTSPDRFARALEELLALLARDVARIYVITIAPPGRDNARRSPGLAESIQKYNHIIARVAARIPSVRLVDVWAEFSRESEPLDAFVSPLDGHHLTARGHERIFELIIGQEAQWPE